ncbi:FkbM family methyltransferase [Sphingomonas oleivorans]|uniref:FkbM family methyltransferase n=2 Tax=Sphingomonas oleivorans TaxID=1735121 RepID=A0A2T5FX04_9SPHN|nr:FkbM family methyltransferase [Sphingomonas oleivorans]
MRRISKLLAEPAFRADPVAVIGRAVALTGMVALGREPIFPLTKGGERLRVPADLRYTTVSAYLLRDRVEPDLHELHRLLGPGDIFLDVGANIGLYTVKAARLVGSTGKVIALEPGHEAYLRLQRNVELNGFGHVTMLREAASDTDGEALLHHVPLGDDPQAFSLIANARAEAGERVKTRRLDRLVEDLGLTRLDLVKIDVEGAEPMVLRGGLESLARLKPAVLFECNAYLNAGGEGGSAETSWALLEGIGYRFFRLIDGDFRPIDVAPGDFCNILAVHPEAASRISAGCGRAEASPGS